MEGSCVIVNSVVEMGQAQGLGQLADGTMEEEEVSPKAHQFNKTKATIGPRITCTKEHCKV